MNTLQTYIARALVRLAIWTAPADKAGPLEVATRPIWRPESSGGRGEEK